MATWPEIESYIRNRDIVHDQVDDVMVMGFEGVARGRLPGPSLSSGRPGCGPGARVPRHHQAHH